MRRVLVVGAGFFGGLVTRRLRDDGIAPLVATRRGADVRLDAEDDASVAAVLREGDVIVDTAGPFASRTTRLLRAAIERRCDVVDLAESLAWSEAVLALDARAAENGVRVYPACSAVAAVTGACIRASGIAAPESVDQFLAPASAETASPATVRGFVRSIGLPIRTLRDGRIVTVRGYVETRAFPAGPHRGGIVENAGAVLLPWAWPTMRRADLWVDPNTPLAQAALGVAARHDRIASLARSLAPRIGAGPLASRAGEYTVAVSDGARAIAFRLSAPRGSYLIATEPAAIVAAELARRRPLRGGVMLPDAQVEPETLFERLRSLGIDIARA